ncbi:MAG TPA: alpha/beta fold hydrolase [Candidatus Binataceae bacterium]|nr:alpha/beta fold hydrolase [Candidatus Binataceae bacterium]
MITALLAGTLATPEQEKIQLRGMFTDEAIAHQPEIMRKHEAIRSQFAAPPYSYARQAQGVMGFDATARLGEIRVPTMVITGTGDRLVPPGNSRAIAQRIPGATLKELPGGHLFFFEHPDLFNKAVIDFVKAHP